MHYPVTVIIPLHIVHETDAVYAEEAIRSAIANSCYISIWDDSDHSDKEVVNLAAQLRKLLVTANERITWNGDSINRGVSFARNMAVSHAQTDLILPLDCDDVLEVDAVEQLYKAYNGTPIYPDVEKFGVENVKHYRLLDFHCDHLREKVGLSSVCVLHERKHWQAIGGWREDLDFYEDGEYNARLFGTFCGQNLHQPLYRYRQHQFQKTRKRAKESAAQVRHVLSIIKEYDMACCGKGRKNTSNKGVSTMIAKQSAVQESNPEALPLQQGDRVLALYVGGKGKGKHYKTGPKTKYKYRVQYGGYFYVFHEDTRLEQEDPSRSPFVRVVRELRKTGERVAVKADEKQPIPEFTEDFEEVIEGDEEIEEFEEEELEEEYEDDDEFEDEILDLVDIVNMSWNSIRHYDFTPEEAKELLKMEKQGKNRVKFIAKLEREAKG